MTTTRVVPVSHNILVCLYQVLLVSHEVLEPLLTIMSENVLPQWRNVINIGLEFWNSRTVVQGTSGTGIIPIL